MKITVIFGGNVGFYLYSLQTFNAIEKYFDVIIKRTGHFKFKTKINRIAIDFLFAYGPTRDQNYNIRKEKFAIGEKEIIPLPADEVVKKIKKSDVVLLFGLCGTFKGKKSEVYIPNCFKEILFEKEIIKHEEIFKIKLKNTIKIKNILRGKLNDKSSTMVTSNLTLMPRVMEDGKENSLILLADKLSKYADAVDKESYQIAKHFKNKKLGIMLVASDVLSIKHHMMKENQFDPNKTKFNQNCINALKEILKYQNE